MPNWRTFCSRTKRIFSVILTFFLATRDLHDCQISGKTVKQTRISMESSSVAGKRSSVTINRKRTDDSFFNTMGLDLGINAVSSEPYVEEETADDASTSFFVADLQRDAFLGAAQPRSAHSQHIVYTRTPMEIPEDEEVNPVPARKEVSKSRIEELIIQFGSDPHATVGSALLDAPPPFGARDLADILDLVLNTVAREMGVSVDVVAGAHVPGASTRNASVPKAELTPAQMGLKIKTISYANAEMGKKLERANAHIGELSSKLAALEGETARAQRVVRQLGADRTALEFRARTAEAAVNAYNSLVAASRSKLLEAAASSLDGMAGLDAARIVSVRLADAPASGQGLSSDEDAGWQPNDADPTEVNPREVNQMELNQMELNPTEVNPTEITRKVISDTARMLAAKKKFDPPTVLFVGLKACLDRESRMANKAVPVNPNSRIPGKKYMSATSFHPSNTVEHLAHIAVDHKTHLSNVLRAQTQQLLASSTPAEYLRTLHAQLEGMTRALHECIDALAEERRMRESWRGKWEKAAWKLQKEIERRRSELQGRASGRVRECYLVNGLEPVAWSRGQVETLEAFLALEKDGGGTPQRQNSGETMMQRRRLLHTAPESSSRMQPGEFGSDLADVYGDRYDARSKSASVTATNRPKYLPDSGPTDKIPRLHLKHPNKNAEPQSRPEKIPRIPTARTEIENDSILDKRLVEVKANYSIVSVRSSAQVSSTDRTISRGKPKKVNYRMPPVSNVTVTPFENPLIKKALRKRSPASALKYHWGTSDKI